MKMIWRRSAATVLALLCLTGTAVASPWEEPALPAVEPVNVELDLKCRGAILMEQETGQILYEKEADARLPIASVTKVMTLLLTMEAVEKGVLHPEDKVPVSELASSMGGSQVFLSPGEEITLDEVLKAVFVSSANDGAVALAELVSGSVEGFVAAMNEKAASLGMRDTVFYNPTGLDDGDTNLSSARDVAVMSRALLAIDGVTKYSSIWIDSIRNGAFGLSNTNKLIRFYPGATGLKTGSTDKAKYCVSASAERNGLKLIAVVLAGESSRDRWNAAKTLLDHGFAGYAFFRPEALAPEKIPVWGGVAPEVTPEAVSRGFLLNKADAVGLESRIELAPSLSAPVEKGQTVGTVQYVKDDRVILELPVTAAEAVPRLSYGGVLAALCRRLLCG